MNISFKVFLLFLFCSYSAVAQNSKSEKSANHYFALFNYKKAIDYYESASALSEDGKRKLADSYRFVNDIPKALEIYKGLASTGSALSADVFLYAQTLKMAGRYDESDLWMDKFHAMSSYDSRGVEYTAFPNYADHLKKDQDHYKITTLNINSEQEDFSPSYYQNKVVFASSREKFNAVTDRRWNGTQLPFIDIYVCDTMSSGQLSNAEDFPIFSNEKYHD